MAFTGKVALVTGGGSGLGQAAALRLAAGGATVAVVDRDEVGILATAESGGPHIVSTHICDVTDEAAVLDVVGRVESIAGPIDRVVHAAGIMPAGRILETP